MWCKNASHFKLSFQWQVLGFQQLLWNPFNWSSMKIWGVQLKFTSQTHPDFIKDLIFLYLPIKYIYKCVWVYINQYLLDNCWFGLFSVFFWCGFFVCFVLLAFFPLKEQFPFSLWRMNSALHMQWELEWAIRGRSFPLPLPQDGIWSTHNTLIASLSCFVFFTGGAKLTIISPWPG